MATSTTTTTPAPKHPWDEPADDEPDTTKSKNTASSKAPAPDTRSDAVGPTGDPKDGGKVAFGESPETSGILSSAGQASTVTVDASGAESADREEAEAAAAKDALSDPKKLSKNERMIEVFAFLKEKLANDSPNAREKFDSLIASLGGPDRTGE